MVGADGWTHVRPNPKPNARACPVFRAKITPRGPWGATVTLMIGPSIIQRTVELRTDLLQSSCHQKNLERFACVDLEPWGKRTNHDKRYRASLVETEHKDALHSDSCLLRGLWAETNNHNSPCKWLANTHHYDRTECRRM